jgi:hypothetical protein
VEFLDELEIHNSAYEPVVMTSWEDDTIGETISGSSGTPSTEVGYGFAFGPVDLTGTIAHFRISHIEYGIYAQSLGPEEFYHFQFVKCGTAILAEHDVYLGNALMDHCTVGFEGDSVLIRSGHLTMNTASYIHSGNYSTLQFTNSLFVAVDAKLYGSGSALAGAKNGFYDVDSGFPFGANPLDEHASGPPFVTAGAGSNYLDQQSDAVTGGTIDGIPPTLRDDIRTRTTKAPQLLTGTLSQNVTWAPTGIADTADLSHPDLGFHFPIVDYLVSGLTANLKTITVLDGTIVAFDFREAAYGLRLQGSDIVSRGGATKLNRFIRAHAVQEQRLPYSVSGNANFKFEAASSTVSTARFRFSKFSMMAGAGSYFYDITSLDKWEFLHSQVHGGRFNHQVYGNSGKMVGWTNCLFERVNIELLNAAPGYLFLYNNTFFGGTLSLASAASGWVVKDNLFDAVTLSEGPHNIGNSHNAYFNTSTLSGSGPHRTLTTLLYENGPLGRFYIDSTPGPISSGAEAGWRTASRPASTTSRRPRIRKKTQRSNQDSTTWQPI